MLRKEKDEDYRLRPQEAPNIWEGQFIGHGRRVWPDFNPAIHVKEFPNWEHLLRTKANCFAACDPAKHYYPAVVFGARWPKPDGKGFYTRIYNEWPTRADVHDDFHNIRKKIIYNGTIGDMAREFKSKAGTARWGNPVSGWFLDTRYARGSGAGDFVHGETSGWVEQFARKENGGREEEKYKDFSDAVMILYAGMEGWRYQLPLLQETKEKSTEPVDEVEAYPRVSGSGAFF